MKLVAVVQILLEVISTSQSVNTFGKGMIFRYYMSDLTYNPYIARATHKSRHVWSLQNILDSSPHSSFGAPHAPSEKLCPAKLVEEKGLLESGDQLHINNPTQMPGAPWDFGKGLTPTIIPLKNWPCATYYPLRRSPINPYYSCSAYFFRHQLVLFCSFNHNNSVSSLCIFCLINIVLWVHES